MTLRLKCHALRKALSRDECIKYLKLRTFPMSLVAGGGRISSITRRGSKSIMTCGEGRLDCNTGSGSISSVTPHGRIVFTVTCGGPHRALREFRVSRMPCVRGVC